MHSFTSLPKGVVGLLNAWVEENSLYYMQFIVYVLEPSPNNLFLKLIKRDYLIGFLSRARAWAEQTQDSHHQQRNYIK